MSEDTKIMTAAELFDGSRGDLSVRVMQTSARRGYDMFFDMENLANPQILSIVDFTVKEVQPYELYPTNLRLSQDCAQQLINDLWRLGVRPAGEHGTNEINALTRHLEDMRAIASNRLKLTLP